MIVCAFFCTADLVLKLYRDLGREIGENITGRSPSVVFCGGNIGHFEERAEEINFNEVESLLHRNTISNLLLGHDPSKLIEAIENS